MSNKASGESLRYFEKSHMPNLYRVFTIKIDFRKCEKYSLCLEFSPAFVIIQFELFFHQEGREMTK